MNSKIKETAKFIDDTTAAMIREAMEDLANFPVDAIRAALAQQELIAAEGARVAQFLVDQERMLEAVTAAISIRAQGLWGKVGRPHEEDHEYGN